MAAALVHWILASLCLVITAYIVPGFTVSSIWSALFAAVVLGVLNVLVWPALALLTLPFTVLTFGLFLLVLNGVILKFGAALVPGFSITGFSPAFFGAIVLTFVGWLVRFVIYKHSVN